MRCALGFYTLSRLSVGALLLLSERVNHLGEDIDFSRPAQHVELTPVYVLLASASFNNGEVYGVTGATASVDRARTQSKRPAFFGFAEHQDHFLGDPSTYLAKSLCQCARQCLDRYGLPNDRYLIKAVRYFNTIAVARCEHIGNSELGELTRNGF